MLTLIAVLLTLETGSPSGLHSASIKPTSPLDTVSLAIVDLRGDTAGKLLPLEFILDSIRVQLPDRVVAEASRPLAYEGEPGRLFLQVFVETYGLSFEGSTWKAAFIGSVRIVDSRSSGARTARTSMAYTDSKFNWKGNASGRDALKRLTTRVVAQVASLITGPALEKLAFSPISLVADAEEYEPYLHEGTGAVAGQGFLMTRAGDAKRAAGRDVTLDPLTEYTKGWYRTLGIDLWSAAIEPADPLFHRSRRSVVADADGRFTFTGIAPGEYLVRTTVTWEVPSLAGLEFQGGVVSEIVTVRPGERSEVVLRRAAILRP